MKISASFSKQSLLRWADLILLIILFTGVLVLINYIAFRHNPRFDLTPEKRFSLAPQSVSILKSLTNDVQTTVFIKQDKQHDFDDLLELFSRASSHFHYSFINLEKNPAKAEALGIRAIGAGIVEYNGRKEKVQYFTEEKLTSALIRLTEKNERIVRFVTGHGEKDIYNFDDKTGYHMVKQALESENYLVEDILLMQLEKVPEDTIVLVVGGPKKDFFQKELDMLDKYLRDGGRLLMLCDPCPLPRIEKYLQKLNIRLERNFIIDKKSKLLGLDDMSPIIVTDKSHPIAKYMNDAVVFPVCRSVIPTNGAGIGMSILAQSGPDSWAEQDTESVYNDQPRFDKDRDIKGPVPVAVVTPVQPADKGRRAEEAGQAVIMGNSSFASNHYINVLGNKDLFLNTVNWLAEKKLLLSTRKKAGQTPVSMLFLTENENKLLLWSAVIIEPGIILLLGLLVALWRRIKR